MPICFRGVDDDARLRKSLMTLKKSLSMLRTAVEIRYIVLLPKRGILQVRYWGRRQGTLSVFMIMMMMKWPLKGSLKTLEQKFALKRT